MNTHEIVHKDSGKIIGTFPSWEKAYEAYTQLGYEQIDHAIGQVDTGYLEMVRKADTDYELSRQRYEAMRVNRGEPPHEIDEHRFWDLLTVLMPADWTQKTDTESFRLNELHTDDLYTWCARIGDRYFEMVLPKKTTHAHIIKLVKKAAK